MVGESGRKINYRKSADQAFADLKAAFPRIGKLTEASPTTMTVTGTTRFGAQSVKLRISIIEVDSKSCLIEIQGFGDDVWGAAARKGTDKLLRALDNPNYRAGCFSVIILCLLLCSGGATAIYFLL
jgi:hypothetical protein